jgi:anti-anti-sigma regulatory factor
VTLRAALRSLEGPPPCTLVELSGTYGGPGDTEAWGPFDALLDVGLRFAVVDLDGITAMESPCFARLVRAADLLAERAGGLAVVAATARARVTLDLLGLGDWLLASQDVDAALLALRALPDRPLAVTLARRLPGERPPRDLHARLRARRAGIFDRFVARLRSGAVEVAAEVLDGELAGGPPGAPRGCLLEVRGPFDERAGALCEEAFERARLTQGATAALVDLSRARGVTDVCFGWLLRWAEALEARQALLVLVNVAPDVREAMEALELGRRFVVCDDLAGLRAVAARAGR